MSSVDYSLLGAALLVAAATPVAAQDGAVVKGELGKKLDRVVQTTTQGGYWGAVLVARKGEVLLSKGYGFADYGTRPNTPRSLFEIASASKQFTAAGILRLVQQKKLKLKDTLGKLFKRIPPDKRRITVHQLLTHTSGISPRTGIPYGSPLKRDAAVRRFLQAPLASRPGRTFAYSNAGYSILAAIIEVVSKTSFEAFMKQEVFKPAGLSDTGFVRDETLDAKRVTERLSERMPGTATQWFWSWGYRGMGGVVTTVQDLLKWHQALRGTTVFDARTKKVMFTPQRANYACGWLVETTARGTTKHHHSGRVAGYGANVVRYPQEDALIVLLSNGATNVMTITNKLEALLFRAPTVTLEVDARPYTLGKYQVVELKQRASWAVRRKGTRTTLVLQDRTKKHAAATIELPAGVVKKLRLDLARMVRAKGGVRPGQRAAMDSGLYLGPYLLRDRRLTVRDGLKMHLMPRYVGVGEGGRRIVDERITFIVMDSRRGQWPVMSKLNLAAAQALHDALKQVPAKAP